MLPIRSAKPIGFAAGRLPARPPSPILASPVPAFRPGSRPTVPLTVREIFVFMASRLRSSRSGAVAYGVLLLTALLLSRPGAGAAQQFVVDDAAIVEPRACQFEAWYAADEAWLLPACHVAPRLELAAGVGALREDERRTEFVLQGKYLFTPLEAPGLAIGLVGGVGLDRLAQLTGGPSGFFAYVPLSWTREDERLVLHANLGWHRVSHEGDEPGDAHAHHESTWGIRTDLVLPLADERLTLIGEIFGEGRSRPAYQMGGRGELLPERLSLDLSWRAPFRGAEHGGGAAIGVAWTPPPFF